MIYRKINLKPEEQRAEPISKGLAIYALYKMVKNAVKWLFDVDDSVYKCKECHDYSYLHKPKCSHCHADNPYWRKTE